MINELLQCCYTNVSTEVGGKITSGWGVVAMSENVPTEAYNKCTDFFSKNSTINKIMVDENHKPLNLFEISGDGNYLYVSRTQYGLFDRLGRPNMFAQAFILPCSDQKMIADPNNYLTIAKENFKDNVEDASAYQESVIRTSPFSLENALSKANMSDESYKILISCLYVQMTDNKSKEPLYIKYNGTEEEMFSIIYCIYCGLPLAIRRVLSIASNYTENLVNKNIIFTQNIEDKSMFFDPQTGDNNVLTPRAEKKIARLGYILHAVSNYRRIDVEDYFVKLEEAALNFGYSSNSSELTPSNELLLKISYQLLTTKSNENLEDSDLDERLSDALRSKSIGSHVMNSYISKMLDEMTRRSLALSEDTEANLIYRLEVDKSEDLKNAEERYNLHRFSLLNIPEAAKKLSAMPTELFEEYQKKICESEKGVQILDYYYSEQLDEAGASWEKLAQVIEKTRILPECKKVNDKVSDIAWTLYCSSFRTNNMHIIATEYANYMNLMSKLVPADRINDCDDSAKNNFWDQFDFNYLRLYSPKDYEVMRADNNRKSCIVFDLFNLSSVCERSLNKSEFFAKLYNFFINYRMDLSDRELMVIKNKIIDDFDYSQYAGSNFKKWVELIVKAPSTELAQKLCTLYSYIERHDLEGILKVYESVYSMYKFTVSGAPYALTELVIEVVQSFDDIHRPVSLDTWLRIGGTIEDNAFTILDKVNPCILKTDSEFAIKNSDAFSNPDYISMANEYIRRKTEGAKIIKKWINDYKDMAKKKFEAEQSRGHSGDRVRGRINNANSQRQNATSLREPSNPNPRVQPTKPPKSIKPTKAPKQPNISKPSKTANNSGYSYNEMSSHGNEPDAKSNIAEKVKGFFHFGKGGKDGR